MQNIDFRNHIISYLLPNCGISGGVAVVLNHVNRLQDMGFTCRIITEGSDIDTSWFPKQRVPVLSLQNYPADTHILVATAWSTAFTVAELPASRKFYFVQSDETRFHPQDSLWQHLATLSYCFDFEYITEARWIQSWLRDKFGHHAHLVPNGLDSELFYPCEPIVPKGSRPRILLEGAIALPYKGMAEAFAVVQDLDVEVWCVSSLGEPQPGWKCDRFFKQVPMDRMRSIYSSCDILLKLSRVEGFFGPPLEMMACGGVSVVGKVTGYDEYIVDGVNAIVVEAGDVLAAKRAIEMLVRNPEIMNKIRENGFKTAAKWTWDKSAKILREVYNSPNFDRYESFFRHKLNKNASIAAVYRHCLLVPVDMLEKEDNASVHFYNGRRLSNWLVNKSFFCYVATAVVKLYCLFKRARSLYFKLCN